MLVPRHIRGERTTVSRALLSCMHPSPIGPAGKQGTSRPKKEGDYGDARIPLLGNTRRAMAPIPIQSLKDHTLMCAKAWFSSVNGS